LLLKALRRGYLSHKYQRSEQDIDEWPPKEGG
jgi:hypothetical protein